MAERINKGGDGTGRSYGGEKETEGVERTRRGVETMEVEEGGSFKASSDKIRGKIAAVAKEGWAKIRMKLQGKGLKRDGSVLVVEEKGRLAEQNERSEEMEGEWTEEGIGGIIQVEEVEGKQLDAGSYYY
jgi:hypothetical protein